MHDDSPPARSSVDVGATTEELVTRVLVAEDGQVSVDLADPHDAVVTSDVGVVEHDGFGRGVVADGPAVASGSGPESEPEEAVTDTATTAAADRKRRFLPSSTSPSDLVPHHEDRAGPAQLSPFVRGRRFRVRGWREMCAQAETRLSRRGSG